MTKAKTLTAAVRALGFTPMTVPTHIPNGVCMIAAKSGERVAPAKLRTLAAQFGMTWELHTIDDNFYGHWVLES